MGYDENDWKQCEVWGCGSEGVDVHHIDCKGMGSSKDKDYIENLILLCRKHHTDLGDRKHLISFLKGCHKSKMIEMGVQFNPNLIIIDDVLQHS